MIEERSHRVEPGEPMSESPSLGLSAQRRVSWSEAFVTRVKYDRISFRQLSGPLVMGCSEQDLYIPPSIRAIEFGRIQPGFHLPTQGEYLRRFRFLDIKGSFSREETLAEVMKGGKRRPGTYEELLAIRHDVRSADGADRRYVISLGSVARGVPEFRHPFLFVRWLGGTELWLDTESSDSLFAPTFETAYPGISRRFLVACED